MPPLPPEKPIHWIRPPVADGKDPLRIRTVSPTRADIVTKCPRMGALKFIYKIDEPKREGETPLERGDRLHHHCENYITGEEDILDKEIEFFRDDPLPQLRKRWEEQPETIRVEQRWNFDDTWTPCGDNEWNKIWTIMKLDVFVFIEESEAVAIDWKSGKKIGNEVKHGEQMLSYCIGSLMRFPQLDRVHAELVYIDQNEVSEMTLERSDLQHFLPRVNRRYLQVTERTEFPPTPSKYSCRWCPYKTGPIIRGVFGTGHCDMNP